MRWVKGSGVATVDLWPRNFPMLQVKKKKGWMSVLGLTVTDLGWVMCLFLGVHMFHFWGRAGNQRGAGCPQVRTWDTNTRRSGKNSRCPAQEGRTNPRRKKIT